MLNGRERQAISWASKHYLKKFGHAPAQNRNLVLHLGDNPQKFLNWSAKSGRLPTRRLASSKLWHFQEKRWLTAKEVLCSLGFPATPETALAMGVPMLALKDSKRAAHLAGNAMHFSTVSIVLLVALAACQLRRHKSEPSLPHRRA